jgi:hypothetical protein
MLTDHETAGLAALVADYGYKGVVDALADLAEAERIALLPPDTTWAATPPRAAALGRDVMLLRRCCRAMWTSRP